MIVVVYIILLGVVMGIRRALGVGLVSLVVLVGGCKDPSEVSGKLIYPPTKVAESGVVDDVGVEEVVSVVGKSGYSVVECKELQKKSGYSVVECKELQNVLYGEAANQSRLARKYITRMTLNRVGSPDYGNSISRVIEERNTFSCTFDGSRNWKQAIGKLPRNEYEEMIYKRCGEDTLAILNGERLGIEGEDKIIAYHDTSVKYEELVAKEKVIQKKWEKRGKRYDGFWMKLKPLKNGKVDRLIFYVPKKD